MLHLSTCAFECPATNAFTTSWLFLKLLALTVPGNVLGRTNDWPSLLPAPRRMNQWRLTSYGLERAKKTSKKAQIKSGGAGQADRPQSSFSDACNFWKTLCWCRLFVSDARNFFIRAFVVGVVGANFSNRKSKKSDLRKFRVFLSAPLILFAPVFKCSTSFVCSHWTFDFWFQRKT